MRLAMKPVTLKRTVYQQPNRERGGRRHGVVAPSVLFPKEGSKPDSDECEGFGAIAGKRSRDSLGA